MTGPTSTGNRGPRKGLSAPESAQNPEAGTERHPGGANGPQTGAQGLGVRSTASGADRQPAYAAVYAYIASLPDRDNAYRNAQIWRAVHTALDAADANADAWCKTCRRVWDGPRHQCESDAEQRLARVRALAERWRYTGDRKGGPAMELRNALDDPLPAPDAGPTVAECRDHDRRWALEREGE